ncbi:exosortase system-associated protein, TIGR04073 family [Geomobilimonas luticola]|nr:exosortase system-associated protein, TIGR04073 family [Geomobilimonas luticola]
MNRHALKKMAGVALLCGGLLCGQALSARADNFQTVESSSPQQVVGSMSGKMVRGITNVATGWLEFPMQIYLTFKNEGVTKGLTVGPLKGLGMTLVRTVTGAAETTTFFLAYPGFYDPYFEPEFAWEEE